jgi:Protein of unknown function (DUF429)
VRIYGIDFTSRPSVAKPIVCAECELIGQGLTLLQIHSLTTLGAFERFLETPSPWLCGVDAPFAQPRKLIEDLGLKLEWPSYVSAFIDMGKEGFVNCLNTYRERQPVGQKEHLREVDKLAKAISPMKLYGVPVGKMFFELAPRLLKTSLNIPALRPTSDKRTVLEIYPSLVARALIGKQSYKSDAKEQQTPEREKVRTILVKLLESPKLQNSYNIKVKLNTKQKQLLITDAKGDALDAFLAAIQTAWAYQQENFGFPNNVDGLEGWISDPSLKIRKLRKSEDRKLGI